MSSKMKDEGNSKPRKISYSPIATEEGEEPATEEDRSCGARLLKDMRFQNLMGAVIVGNGAVIGLETDNPGWGHWTEVENGFLFIFLCEVTLKICVEGRQFFSCQSDDFGWNMFDSFIVGLGVFDVVASFIGAGGSGGFATVFRMVRLLRILRIFRLLKFLKRLFLLAMGLIEACKAVFWVTILMAFVLYMCSIVLVKMVGRPSTSDPHFEFLNLHFGHILESMLTLFVLMSSPNLPIYQEENGLLEGRPLLTIFLIIFITFGSFGMIAMLTGVINQSMFENNEMQKEEKRLAHEAQRRMLGQRCNELWESFENVDEDGYGEVPVEDIAKKAPQIVKMLEAAGSRIDHGDIVKLVYKSDVDASGTLNIDEFAHAMEQVAEGLTPLSMLEVHHAVGACTRKLVTLEGKIIDEVEKSSKVLCGIESQEARTIQTEESISAHIGENGKQMIEIRSKLDAVLSLLQNQSAQSSAEPGMGKSLQQLQSTERQQQQQQMLERMERQLLEKMDRTVVQTQLAISEQMGAIGKSMQKLSDRTAITDITDTRKASVTSAQAPERPQLVQALERPQFAQQFDEFGKVVQGLSDHIDRSETRVQIAVSQQLGDVKSSLQRLLEEKKDSTSASEPINSTLAQHMSEIKLSVQRILEQKAGSSSLQQYNSEICEMKSEITSTLAQHMGEIKMSVQRILEQKASASSPPQQYKSEIGEMKSCLQRTLDERDSSSALALQIGELKSSVHGVVAQQVGEFKSSVQRLLEQRSSGDESRSNPAIEQIQGAVQRLLDLSEGGRDVRLQLALSKQMEEIGMSVQMLLRQREENSQGGLAGPCTIIQQPKETQKSLQSSEQMEEIRKSVQVLVLKEDTREVRLQVLQKAVDATTKSVLGGLGELASVILGGVADIFAKNAATAQHEHTHRLLQELAASHEALRSTLVAQSSWNVSRLSIAPQRNPG